MRANPTLDLACRPRKAATAPRHPRRRRSCSRCSRDLDRGHVGDRVLRRPSPRRAARRSGPGRRPRSRTIRVERGWDDMEGPIAPKSQAGAGRCSCSTRCGRSSSCSSRGGRDPDALVFGSTACRPFEPRRRAEGAAWERRTTSAARRPRSEQPPIEWFGLHEAATLVLDVARRRGSARRARPLHGPLARAASPAAIGTCYRASSPRTRRRVDDYLAGTVAGKVVEMKRPAVGVSHGTLVSA